MSPQDLTLWIALYLEGRGHRDRRVPKVIHSTCVADSHYIENPIHKHSQSRPSARTSWNKSFCKTESNFRNKCVSFAEITADLNDGPWLTAITVWLTVMSCLLRIFGNGSTHASPHHTHHFQTPHVWGNEMESFVSASQKSTAIARIRLGKRRNLAIRCVWQFWMPGFTQSMDDAHALCTRKSACSSIVRPEGLHTVWMTEQRV